MPGPRGRLWAGLPVCSHFLHDVIPCGAGWGSHERGFCSQRPGPRVSGLPCPCRTALPTSVGQSHCPGPAPGWLVTSHEPQVLSGTGWEQTHNLVTAETDAEGPSLSAPWDRQPRVAEAVAWARVSAPYPHRCHLGQVSPPHPSVDSPLGQRARPAGTPAGERVGGRRSHGQPWAWGPTPPSALSPGACCLGRQGPAPAGECGTWGTSPNDPAGSPLPENLGCGGAHHKAGAP